MGCASTLSDSWSCLASAIGTLKGPLHGGANEAAHRMLTAWSDPQAAIDGVKSKLASKSLIFGFGHRVYMKKGDPRNPVAKRISKVSVSLHCQMPTLGSLPSLRQLNPQWNRRRASRQTWTSTLRPCTTSLASLSAFSRPFSLSPARWAGQPTSLSSAKTTGSSDHLPATLASNSRSFRQARSLLLSSVVTY